MHGVYIIKTSGSAEREYKIGRHTGTNKKLLQRYSASGTQIPTIHLWLESSDYVALENKLLEHYREKRRPNDERGLSEVVVGVDLLEIIEVALKYHREIEAIPELPITSKEEIQETSVQYADSIGFNHSDAQSAKILEECLEETINDMLNIGPMDPVSQVGNCLQQCCIAEIPPLIEWTPDSIRKYYNSLFEGAAPRKFAQYVLEVLRNVNYFIKNDKLESERVTAASFAQVITVMHGGYFCKGWPLALSFEDLKDDLEGSAKMKMIDDIECMFYNPEFIREMREHLPDEMKKKYDTNMSDIAAFKKYDTNKGYATKGENCPAAWITCENMLAYVYKKAYPTHWKKNGGRAILHMMRSQLPEAIKCESIGCTCTGCGDQCYIGLRLNDLAVVEKYISENAESNRCCRRIRGDAGRELLKLYKKSLKNK